jgi:hypothetical protein
MSRVRLFATALLAAALVVFGVPFLSGDDITYAAQARITATPGAPIANESFALTGRFATHFQRPAQLQYRTASGWKTLATKRTYSTGGYRFVTRTSVNRLYRVVLPAVRHHLRRYGALTSPTRTVTVVTQSGSLTMLPAIAQKGTTPASSTGARSVITATFRPVRPGRAVFFQQRKGTSWTTVKSTTQNAHGSATFLGAPGPASAPYAYRAVTGGYHGAGAKRTAPARVTDAWTAVPTLSTEFSGTSLPAPWDYRATDLTPAEQKAQRRACSRSDRRAVSVGGGVLQLKVKLDPDRRGQVCKTSVNGTTYKFPYYINGHVGTDQAADGSFTYGIAAARVNFPAQRGEHGSFWLQGGRSEVDTVEYFGAGRHTVNGDESRNIYQFIHYTPTTGAPVSYGGFQKNSAKLLTGTDQWHGHYHVFSVEWTPTRYIFRVDGVETFRTSRGTSPDPHYMVLSLLSSDWELPGMDNSKLPTHMSVDWVKVWQRPGATG